MLDAGNLHLRKLHPQTQQGVCADAIATMEGIDRRAVDELALVSQQRAAQAIKENRFAKSLVTVYNEDGSVALEVAVAGFEVGGPALHVAVPCLGPEAVALPDGQSLVRI